MTWPSDSLGNLVKVTGGGTPSMSNHSFYVGGTIPWVTPKDMKRWEIQESKIYITEEAVRQSAAKMIPANSVLVTIRSGVLKHTLPIAVTRRPVAVNQDLKAFTCGSKLDAEFLARYLKSAEGIVLGWVRGTTADNVPLPKLLALAVPLPPLPEQKRIAAILDKADEIRKKRAETIRLTEELLKSAFLEMFGDPVTNPKGWPVRKLGEVCTFVGGGTPARAKPEFFTGTIPWATSKDIRGEIFVDSEEHVTQAGIDSSSTKLVPPQTLLIVVKSKVLMNRLPVTISEVAVCFGQDLKGIVLTDSSLRPEFVLRFLKLSAQVLLPQARGANTEGLTLDHLRNLAMPIPAERAIQKYQEFAARVRSSLKFRQGDDSAALSASLTQRAFRGEL